MFDSLKHHSREIAGKGHLSNFGWFIVAFIMLLILLDHWDIIDLLAFFHPASLQQP